MKFVYRWLKRKIEALDEDIPEQHYGKTRGRNVVSSDVDNTFGKGIRFNIYNADGGYVVETWWYDKNHDRQTGLYVVTNDQNLSERLDQIFTFEAIKR